MLSVKETHSLDQYEIIKRLDTKVNEGKAQYGPLISNDSYVWDDTTLTYEFTVMGGKIQGNVYVRKNEVEITAKIPFRFFPFKGKAESIVQGYLESILQESP